MTRDDAMFQPLEKPPEESSNPWKKDGRNFQGLEEKGIPLSKRWKRFPMYRNSGMEWFELIPEHWVAKKLKYLAICKLSNVDKKSVEGEEPVALCNYTDVYYNEVISSALDFMEATAPPSQIERFRLYEGDVLITKDSETADDIAVPAVVREGLGDVLCGYHLALLRPRRNKTSGAFLFRAIQAQGVREQFWSAATGITRFGLSQDDIGSAVLPLPPVAEQRAIADFLDLETGRIDALIAKKERQIELLQEKRQALITAAVTGKIDLRGAAAKSRPDGAGTKTGHAQPSLRCKANHSS